jgi:uncharacterized protein (TIGR03067 family)
MRFLLAIVILGTTASCNVEADFSDAMETVTLNANEYRADIIAIDRLIFTETALGEKGARDLASRLEQFAVRIKGNSDKKFLKLESLELRQLAQIARRLPPNGDAAALRNSWMRIRANLFEDEAWMARSAADLDYVPAEDSRTSLTGKWRVARVYGNGEERTDPEMSDALWIIDPPRLSIIDASSKKIDFTFTTVSDENGRAMRIRSDKEDGWMNYELSSQELKVAFFDNLEGGRPHGFEHRDGEPLLVVLRLTPEQ